jgi:hypothetical protein
MKKMIHIIAMFFAVVATAQAFAYGSSALEISVEEFGRYTIEVNGQAYPANTGTLNLNQLMPGNYSVSIVRHEHVGRGYSAAVRHRVMYQGNVFVPNNTVVQGRFNRYGMAFHEVRNNPMPYYQPYAYNDCSRPQPVAYNAAPVYMHDQVFSSLLMSMHRSSFDRSKLEIAQIALRNNQVTTQQVSMMMREFSFDSYRLELAKFAYQSTIDPQNYFVLTNEFTFDSNARALMRYVQH